MLLKNAGPVRRLLLKTGRDKARRLPDIVQIESTNLCNAKCDFCPRDEMHRRQGVMEMDLFRKVVAECAALGITHIRVHNYGEPFLDKQLVEKVRYAKSKGIHNVGMISNGSLITEDLARGMIEAGLDAINISMDAAGREVFERTRIHLKFDDVVGNVRALHRIRTEMGRRLPKLILSFVRQNNSEEEQAFVREWSPLADKIHFTDLHNWAGALNDKTDVRFPCYRLWQTFTVGQNDFGNDFVDSDALSIQLQASKQAPVGFLVFEPYAGVAWEQVDVDLEYDDANGNPVRVSLEGENEVRFTLGAGFNFAAGHVWADYSFANTSNFSFGLALGNVARAQ